MRIERYVEHTLLKPDCTLTQIERLCQEALTHDFVGVCVPPYYVKEAAKYLQKSACKVVTVVGFPNGYNAVSIKAEETRRACDEGAQELDIVINVSALKNGDWQYVRNEIQALTHIARSKDRIVKFILETSLLNTSELLQVADICAEAHVDYVKTSTGFVNPGATPDIISLLRQQLPAEIGIKASGGIKTHEQALSLIAAGATRIGTSAGLALLIPDL